jgi:cobalt-zinc-cadmium efflux system outer membrane protein
MDPCLRKYPLVSYCSSLLFVRLGLLALLLLSTASISWADSGSQATKAAPSVVGAASIQALSLEDVLDEAYQANPFLNASRAQQQVAEGGIVLAKTRINPKINLQAAPVESTYHPIDMAVDIQLGGKRELRVRVAKFQLASTNAQIQTMTWKIRQDTEQAFYEYGIAQKALNVLLDYQGVAERLVQIAKKRQVVGDVAGLDVFRAEAALLDVYSLLAPAQARVHQAQRQLNLLMNRPLEDQITVIIPDTVQLQKTPQALPSIEGLVAQAKVSRPEYKQYQADIDTQKARVKLANAGKWPDIQLGAGISMVPQTRNHFWGENPKYGPEMYAQIPVPIMDHQQGPKAIAQASAIQLVAQRKAFENQVQQELNVAYSNLESATEQLSLYVTQILPKQKEILTTSQQSYGLGFIDATAAITAQQTALIARTNALQVLTRYFQARIELERAVGHPIDYDTAEISPERKSS